jgi:titin
VFLVQSSGVTIDHLKIDGDNPALTSAENVGGANIDARNGIITDHTLATVYNNLSVHDVTVKNIWFRGIYASSGGTFTISNNTVDNVQGQANGSIGIFDFIGGGTFSGNHVSNAADGISANHSNGTTFTGNTVTTSASGIHTDNAGDAGGSPDLITGNTVSSCTAGGYGIWTFVPYLVPTVSGNTVSGCDTGLAAFGSCDLGGTNSCPGGVIPTVVFASNNVTDVSSGFGLVVSTDTFGFGDSKVRVNANHNVISGPGTGVYVEETGVETATVAANRNSLKSLNNTGATNVAATCNWWGQSGGPITGQVTGSATTTPFLRVSNLSANCPATVPGTPTAAFAVPYNDHGAKVGWTAPPNGGAPILGYRIIPYAAGVAQPARIFNSNATTQLISGLTDGTSYRFTVAARNVVGYGPPSAMTAAMIAGAPGQPGAPTVVKVASGSLKNTFAAPMNNGAPITSYSVTCASSNGGVTKNNSGTASPITVTGLTAGKSYVCRVSATNSRGTGPLSNPSAAINA